jgi:hypothetical protein
LLLDWKGCDYCPGKLKAGVTVRTVVAVQVDDDDDILSPVEQAAEHGDEVPDSVAISGPPSTVD